MEEEVTGSGLVVLHTTDALLNGHAVKVPRYLHLYVSAALSHHQKSIFLQKVTVKAETHKQTAKKKPGPK